MKQLQKPWLKDGILMEINYRLFQKWNMLSGNGKHIRSSLPPSTAKYPLPPKVQDFAKRISSAIQIYATLILPTTNWRPFLYSRVWANQKLQENDFAKSATLEGKEYFAAIGTCKWRENNMERYIGKTDCTFAQKKHICLISK